MLRGIARGALRNKRSVSCNEAYRVAHHGPQGKERKPRYCKVHCLFLVASCGPCGSVRRALHAAQNVA